MTDQQLTPEAVDLREKMGPKMARLMADVKVLAAADTPSLDSINQLESRATQLALDRSQIPQVSPPALSEKNADAKFAREDRDGHLYHFGKPGDRHRVQFRQGSDVASWFRR